LGDVGLVNYAVESAAFDKALEVAREIIPAGPIAVKMAKLAINTGSQLDMGSGLAFEQTCYAQVIPTEDRLEGSLHHPFPLFLFAPFI
jgi:methylglutaconyl-CoA hydratase